MIEISSADRASQLVGADWLEEHGDHNDAILATWLRADEEMSWITSGGAGSGYGSRDDDGVGYSAGYSAGYGASGGYGAGAGGGAGDGSGNGTGDGTGGDDHDTTGD